MNKKVLFNGKIYLEKGKFAEACLMEDGLFTKVGTNEEVLAAAGDAEKFDCGGKTVLPGLNDSHCHILMVAQYRSYVQLLGATSIENVIERAKAYLAEHPTVNCLRGMGWNVVSFIEGEKRDLTYHDLDKISTEIPIFFERACGHMSVANSKALEIAGVTAETPQVDGGYIGHEADGKPNGQFSDNAKNLVSDHLPEQTLDDLESNFDGMMKYAASCGLTSVQSNDVGNTMPCRDSYEFMHKYHESGKMLVRYTHQNNFHSVEEIETFVPVERADPRYDDVLTFGPLKLFKDGSIGGHSALMRKPYLDEPETCGVDVTFDDEIDAMVAAADKFDMQVVTHCIGDGAVDALTKSYEKVLRDGKNPLRHGIVHCQIMDREMMERLAKDDILAFEQPIFLHSDMHALETRIPMELARTSNAYKSMQELGIRQSFGTDAPVEDINPFPGIYCAVTRKDLFGNPAEGYFPEECISVEDAVDDYTIASAYAQFMEDRKGRIKEGYFADLTVLDRDIFTCDPMEIKDIKPVLTIMGGNVTFKA